VTRVGSSAVVRVLRQGVVTPVRVVPGAVGTLRTQVTSGVKAGEQVVLADLSVPLPSADTGAGLRGGGFGGGGTGFGGAGPAGAGFGGPAGTGFRRTG
jgi:hypothetical protein